MLRQEMNIGYFDKIHRPGEKLGFFDNESDYECCAQRVHCNAQHGRFGPVISWNEKTNHYELASDDELREIIKGLEEGLDMSKYLM